MILFTTALFEGFLFQNDPDQKEKGSGDATIDQNEGRGHNQPDEEIHKAFTQFFHTVTESFGDPLPGGLLRHGRVYAGAVSGAHA